MFALFALSIAPKRPEPIALTPTRTIWTLALNSQLAVPPAYGDSRAYFSLDGNRLAAYDLVSGRQLWLVEARPIVQPAASAGFLFVPEADSIAALRTGDGSVAWRVQVDSPIATTPTFDDGRWIGAAQDGSVVGGRASDGELLWKANIGARPHGTPVIAGDRVYLSASNGRVVCLLVESGMRVWEGRVGGSPNQILVRGERLYVGSTDNYLYCLLSKNGRIDWRWPTGADVVHLPAADANRVYFVSLDNVLRALSLKSGAQQWMRPLPLRPTAGPVIAGGSLVVAGEAKTIATFNLTDGSAGTDLNAEGEVTAPVHAMSRAGTSLPMVLVVTRDLTRGAAAALYSRSIEPAVAPISPLPYLVTPAPTPAPRH